MNGEKPVVNVAGARKLASEAKRQHAQVSKIGIVVDQLVLKPNLDLCEVKIIAASSNIVPGLHIVITEAITFGLLIKEQFR